MDEKNVNQHFMSLVLMLASACWQQLGKIPNPVSGKSEKDLTHAQMTIDLLMMLREKSKNNLSKEEDHLLNNTISDLQLNYADEAGKTTTPPVN
jgi:hypothetical protein